MKVFASMAVAGMITAGLCFAALIALVHYVLPFIVQVLP